MRRTRLFEWQEQQGLTRRQLAARVGYTHVYLSQIATGARPITDNFEMRCAYALNLPREFLFYDGARDGDASQPEVRAGSGPSPPSSRRPSETG